MIQLIPAGGCHYYTTLWVTTLCKQHNVATANEMNGIYIELIFPGIIDLLGKCENVLVHLLSTTSSQACMLVHDHIFSFD